MARVVPFTKNREVIYGLLERARRYHCTCTSQHFFDVTDLLDVLDGYRSAGNPVSMNACLIRATSMVLEKFPRLNHHLFHGLFRKYEVDFEEICCNVVLLRQEEDGEAILLPLLIERSNELSVEQIDEILERHKKMPLEELPQIQGLQKLKKLPVLTLKLFSFMARSNHRFYRKYFGTYGFSSLLVEGKNGVRLGHHGTAAQSAANTATGFIPASITEEPTVVDGQITARKILSFTFLFDHYLIDGHEALLATNYLGHLLTKPKRIGLQSPEKPSSSQSLE